MKKITEDSNLLTLEHNKSTKKMVIDQHSITLEWPKQIKFIKIGTLLSITTWIKEMFKKMRPNITTKSFQRTELNLWNKIKTLTSLGKRNGLLQRTNRSMIWTLIIKEPNNIITQESHRLTVKKQLLIMSPKLSWSKKLLSSLNFKWHRKMNLLW